MNLSNDRVEVFGTCAYPTLYASQQYHYFMLMHFHLGKSSVYIAWTKTVLDKHIAFSWLSMVTAWVVSNAWEPLLGVWWCQFKKKKKKKTHLIFKRCSLSNNEHDDVTHSHSEQPAGLQHRLHIAGCLRSTRHDGSQKESQNCGKCLLLLFFFFKHFEDKLGT